mmetsp:Transcript_28510/g.34715  ORF Transcript_28510/g.34715 Transcript_28510/m.34715 type:complete len:120 (+) Transcript_28510:153-512(+)
MLQRGSSWPATKRKLVVAFRVTPLESLMGRVTTNQPRSGSDSLWSIPFPRTNATYVFRVVEVGEEELRRGEEKSSVRTAVALFAAFSSSSSSSLLVSSSAYVTSSAPLAPRSRRWMRLT